MMLVLQCSCTLTGHSHSGHAEYIPRQGDHRDILQSLYLNKMLNFHSSQQCGQPHFSPNDIYLSHIATYLPYGVMYFQAV